MKILHRFTGAIIKEIDAADLCGADLCGASLCGADLCGADLRGADLCGASLRGASLRDANLRGASLCGANLCGANLCGADLCGADLCGANLCGANLRDAKSLEKTSIFELAPKVENLHKRIADAVGNGETLEMGNWHKCATTHCRGGWAITLAGDAGRIFEAFTSSDTAARLIYLKSTGMMPNFYANNETALADIKKCAEASV